MEGSEAYDFTVIPNRSKLKDSDEKARAFAKALVAVDAMVEEVPMEALALHPVRPMVQSRLRKERIDFSKCGATAKELLALLQANVSDGRKRKVTGTRHIFCKQRSRKWHHSICLFFPSDEEFRARALEPAKSFENCMFHAHLPDSAGHKAKLYALHFPSDIYMPKVTPR